MTARVFHAVLPIALAIALAGCGATDPPLPSEESGHPGLAVGNHLWNTDDGNEIPYVVTGAGDTTVLLVHCWMCDRSFWSSQIPGLAADYRTISVDLPGHGEASARRDTWTVEGYGRDVAGMIEGLGLSDVVLVGHSMGGPVSLKAAGLSQGRVLGIVAVDTLHDAEFDFSGEQVEAILQAFEADFVGTCEQFVGQMFPEEEDVAEIEEHVRAAGCRESRADVGAALMRDFGSIDMETWFAEAGVPIRAINASAPNPTRVESNRKYADFDVVFMDGVGHYLHMTRPQEFNPLLHAAIAEIVDGSS